MHRKPDPSPRAPVSKRDQPPSPAFSPAGFSGQFAFAKNSAVNKRQNVQQSPAHRHKPHHEILKQEVAMKMKAKPLTPRSSLQVNIGRISSSKSMAPAGEQENNQKANVVVKQRPSKKDLEDGSGGGRWTREEDQKLRQGVQSIGATKWKKISEDYLNGKRSDVQCLHRWQKVLRPGLVKGPWTAEEDNTIRSCIERKVTKWSEIAERIPGRIGKQCRERWFNHLDPSIDHSSWTEEEEKVLVTAQAKFGNRWCEIAKLLPGRPENAVKNRWNSAIRRKWQQKLGLPVTDNKGKLIDPQPPKLSSTLPLPALEPVVKKKTDMNVSGAQNNSSIPPPPPTTSLPPGMQTESNAMAPPAPKPAKSVKSEKKSVRIVGLTNRKKPALAASKQTSGKTKRAPSKRTRKSNQSSAVDAQSFDMNFNNGAASPSGALQWDFNGENGLDLSSNELNQLGLDTDLFLNPCRNLPQMIPVLVQQNQTQRASQILNQRIARASSGVSPIGPLVTWENMPPAELDRGMASLTLSMLDSEFDGLAGGPKTDDSFGVNWNQGALSPPFSPMK